MLRAPEQSRKVTNGFRRVSAGGGPPGGSVALEGPAARRAGGTHDTRVWGGTKHSAAFASGVLHFWPVM